MSNRLAFETSPYLLQHAENPVDWYPWNDEALEKARNEDKPIFLSIGYAACHWCHVMAHETFEDPAMAAIMNEHFINIKVDREERPDLDNIYMTAVVAMTGQGGWPMSVFLTPEGKPFFGGTYFPPTRRYNMPSFREVLLSVKQVWVDDRQKILESSENITAHLHKTSPGGPGRKELDLNALDQAALRLTQAYDWKYGGWGSAPKFPQPMVIEFLLRSASRGDQFALDMGTHALKSMAKGGMYDVVGGGFARYSTDNEWLVPHFEKMLYDNAQLALVYLHAYKLTGDIHFRQICEETLQFITREMTHPSGGFYSSLDADSEGTEGKFYTWTLDQIQDALGNNPEDVEFALSAYTLTEAGNFEGTNVLQRRLDDNQLADSYNLAEAEIGAKLQNIHHKLLHYRELRVRPGTDDKVLTSWNALTLIVFAEVARYFGNGYYLDMAIRNANFIISDLIVDERLKRTWRNGQAKYEGYLEDYAALTIALLSLYQSDPDEKWFNTAYTLAEQMDQNFRDPEFGFYDTHQAQAGSLIMRPKDTQDNAIPSGNALATFALLQLSAYTGRGDWRDLAEDNLRNMTDSIQRYPTAFGYWLCALDFALSSTKEVAILGSPQSPLTNDLIKAIWEAYRPNLILAQGEPDSITSLSPPLLQNRPLSDGKPTAYVCHQLVCKRPVTKPEDLIYQLEA